MNSSVDITFLCIGDDTLQMYDKVGSVDGKRCPNYSISYRERKIKLKNSRFPKLERALIDVSLEELNHLKLDKEKYTNFLSEVGEIVNQSQMIYIYLKDCIDIELIASVVDKADCAVLITNEKDEVLLDQLTKIVDSIIIFETEDEKLIKVLINTPLLTSYSQIDVIDVNCFFKGNKIYHAFYFEGDIKEKLTNFNNLDDVKNSPQLFVLLAINEKKSIMTYYTYVDFISKMNKGNKLYGHDFSNSDDYLFLLYM